MNVRKTIFITLVVTFICSYSYAKTKTIIVDCAKGQRINTALADTTAELIIEVHGLCKEDVQIRRDKITLRGIDPNVDGVQGAATVNVQGYGSIIVRDAREVRIENLLVTGSIRNGIVIYDSTALDIVNCRLIGNANFGIVTSGADVIIANTTITGKHGIGSTSGRTLLCENCTINVERIGLYSVGASWVESHNSNIVAFVSIASTESGEVSITNSTLAGILEATQNGVILLDSVNQTSNPEQNYVLLDSTLRSTGQTNLIGPTSVDEFSKFLMLGNTAHNGDIACSAGSDMVCANPGNISGNVSGCSLCVQSSPTSDENQKVIGKSQQATRSLRSSTIPRVP